MSHDQRTAERATDWAEVTDEGRPGPRERRLELSLAQILAGALAAASAAVAASWLGVAGTVVGAVVASIVVPVSTALYSHPLERSSQVIRESLPVRPERSRGAAPSAAGRTTIVEHPPAGDRRTGSGQPKRRRRIRWGTVAISCLMTLVVGFGLLTAFEEVMGRSFSSLTGSDGQGGTTVGRLVHHATTPGSGGDTQPSGPAPTSGSNTTTPETTAPPTTAPTTTDPATTDPATTDPATTGASAPTQPATTAAPGVIDPANGAGNPTPVQ